MDLLSYGWNLRLAALFETHAAQGLVAARDVRELCLRFWQLSIAKIARVPQDIGNAESPLNKDD